MLYKRGKDLIEAKSLEEAKSIFKAEDGIKAYPKPSKKAFMMWCWMRCDFKDGRLFKLMCGEPAEFLGEYLDDPGIVLRELRKAHIVLKEWAMMGDDDYDVERHSEWFYRKGNLA